MKLLLISSLLVVAAHGGSDLEENLQTIIDTVNSSGAKWKAGQNFDENTKISSLIRRLGVKKTPSNGLESFRERHTIPDSAIPEEFDARDNWPNCPSIKHIRDQGNCGSCWAVAAAGAFTDRLCIATKGKFTEALSQEELLSCCRACGHGCNGGDPLSAWQYFVYNGLVTGGDYQTEEGCQPYEVMACSHHTQGMLPSCDSFPEPPTPLCRRKCTNPSYPKAFRSDHHKVKSAYRLRNDVAEIQKEIIAHGPVEASFQVYSDFLTYKSGVYHHVTGNLLSGHAVKLIGWGVEDGTPYWLVANQWNESWGEKGLFKILRGNNECSFEEDVVGGVPKV